MDIEETSEEHDGAHKENTGQLHKGNFTLSGHLMIFENQSKRSFFENLHIFLPVLGFSTRIENVQFRTQSLVVSRTIIETKSSSPEILRMFTESLCSERMSVERQKELSLGTART